jgi:hypothetical protein
VKQTAIFKRIVAAHQIINSGGCVGRQTSISHGVKYGRNDLAPGLPSSSNTKVAVNLNRLNQTSGCCISSQQSAGPVNNRLQCLTGGSMTELIGEQVTDPPASVISI